MVSLFKSVEEKYVAKKQGQVEPWACFEVVGFETDGRIKVQFNWNDAFIKKIKELGFEAETEDDCVQLFFYTSSMRPTQLSETVAPSEHPNLDSGNQFVS